MSVALNGPRGRHTTSQRVHSIISFFEGRPIDRPTEDVSDQGLAFDLNSIDSRLSRRRLLGMLGIGTGSVAPCRLHTRWRRVDEHDPGKRERHLQLGRHKLRSERANRD